MLCDLAALWYNSHVHEAWGYSSTGWATAEETAYPWPLCRKVAALVALHIQTFGVTCPTPTFATQLLLPARPNWTPDLDTSFQGPALGKRI